MVWLQRPSAHSWLGRNFGSSAARLHLRQLQPGTMARQVRSQCGVFIVSGDAFGPPRVPMGCIGLPNQPFGLASGCAEFRRTFLRVFLTPRPS